MGTSSLDKAYNGPNDLCGFCGAREAGGRRATGTVTACSSRLLMATSTIILIRRSCSDVDGEPAVRRAVRRSKHRLVVVAPSGPCLHTFCGPFDECKDRYWEFLGHGAPIMRHPRGHCRAKILSTENLGAK